MLDCDLAVIYGVETKQMNQAVKRNLDRFPSLFRFQLSEPEFRSLRTQIVTSKKGGRRYLPFAFTKMDYDVDKLIKELRKYRIQ